jgi:hypothetical protein
MQRLKWACALNAHQSFEGEPRNMVLKIWRDLVKTIMLTGGAIGVRGVAWHARQKAGDEQFGKPAVCMSFKRRNVARVTAAAKKAKNAAGHQTVGQVCADSLDRRCIHWLWRSWRRRLGISVGTSRDALRALLPAG